MALNCDCRIQIWYMYVSLMIDLSVWGICKKIALVCFENFKECMNRFFKIVFTISSFNQSPFLPQIANVQTKSCVYHLIEQQIKVASNKFQIFLRAKTHQSFELLSCVLNSCFSRLLGRYLAWGNKFLFQVKNQKFSGYHVNCMTL